MNHWHRLPSVLDLRSKFWVPVLGQKQNYTRIQFINLGQILCHILGWPKRAKILAKTLARTESAAGEFGLLGLAFVIGMPVYLN